MAGRLTGWWLSVAALVLAVAGALAMLFLPSGRMVSVGTGQAGPTEPVASDTTLLETEGGRVVVIAAIPVAIAGFTLPFRSGQAARAVRGGAAALLTVFSALGVFSIGLFFVPAAIVMWVAAFA